MHRPPAGEAIAVDETGLSFGIVEPYRLKTLYRPIFARRGEMLAPVALSAEVTIEQGGRPAADAFSWMDADERTWLCWVGRRLAIRNLDHVGCEDPAFDLLLELSADTEEPCLEADALLAEAEAAGIAQTRVCLDLSEFAGAGAFGLLTRGLEAKGCSFALDLAAASNSCGAGGPATAPALVRIPPAWTRRIVGAVDLLRVLRLLVSTLRQRGALVQIEGIEDAAQLRAAVAAGADRLAGDYLAAPALAGTDFDDSPRAFAKLIGAHSNVVPLSA
ncbi:EAL domain-containing protein [Mesorhizobium sp. LHD-90]|uniref:EAL domain-containing protein n=1 Tax=Mesorhizobium sp. LHD-90 TaxID=3071414 RepID=UPI0027DF52D0|nr:EAL domain-containing protein [Mesorhizobium sp. LHD-90]MDQ6436465.1 EAL domain-containing protein [Mesorhizobium sp. LHD-90]